MAEPKLGDFYLPQSVSEIRDDALTDIRLELINGGASDEESSQAVMPGTFVYNLASADAAMSFTTRSATAAGRQDLTPLTCGPDILEDWRKALQLPDVNGSPSTGMIRVEVTGSSTIPDGREFVMPSGKRGKVVGTWASVVDGDEINVTSVDVGDEVNLDGGDVVRFVNPPLNVATDATVSYSSPLTGGTPTETLERKRTRVLNRLGYAMGGGNWGYLRELAMNALPFCDDGFIYPALGGPSSCKVVATRPFLPGRNEYTRELNAAAIEIIRLAVHEYTSGQNAYFVTTAADESTDVSLQLTIPSSTLLGGDGSGWLDQDPWPSLSGADTRVSVTTVTSTVIIIVNASIATGAVAGRTRIAWWSQNDMRFHVRTVVSCSGSAGAWTLGVDRPLVDSTGVSIQTGDYVCPPCTNLDSYGQTWLDVVGALGPGENVSVTDARRKRHPFVSVAPKSSLTITELKRLIDNHDEITDASWSYRSLTTPTIPGSVDTAPNVLVPGSFGVYPT